MSSFSEPLKVMQISKNLWMTLEDFTFNYNDEIIKVPTGTKTDFASIPRFLWTFFPPIGKYTQSAVLHDFLVVENKRSWKECADIFLEAMKVQEVGEWRRNTMYFFVRAYGYVRKNEKK